jgi:thioredoxin 1
MAHFNKTISENKAVIVDFWATYCGPCMRFKPIYEGYAAANKNKNLVFCSVETDKVRDVS